MAGTSAGDRILLLGQDEARYGAFRSETLDGGRVACCLSVGADPNTPAQAFKALDERWRAYAEGGQKTDDKPGRKKR